MRNIVCRGAAVGLHVNLDLATFPGTDASWAYIEQCNMLEMSQAGIYAPEGGGMVVTGGDFTGCQIGIDHALGSQLRVFGLKLDGVDGQPTSIGIRTSGSLGQYIGVMMEGMNTGYHFTYDGSDPNSGKQHTVIGGRWVSKPYNTSPQCFIVDANVSGTTFTQFQRGGGAFTNNGKHTEYNFAGEHSAFDYNLSTDRVFEWLYQGTLNGFLRIAGPDALTIEQESTSSQFQHILGSDTSSSKFVVLNNSGQKCLESLGDKRTILYGGLELPSPSTPPGSASSVGQTGNITWDSNYIYVCVATNTWKRVGISTW